MHTVHLCNTHGQLLIALCDIACTDAPVTLIYLDDEIPLPPDMQNRLNDAFPHLTLHVCQDHAMIEHFANLPRILPAIMRRNIRWIGGVGHWRPSWLADTPMTHAYISNTGFFMAKVVAGHAQTVTLRESGLNNYVGQRVTGLKRHLRKLAGRRPDWQIMGEEPWVDHIAVARPDDLPVPVRHKGVQLDLQSRLAMLSDDQKQILLSCLAPNFPPLPDSTRTALLLTQPLDLVGMCDTQTKQRLYSDIVTLLSAAGFTVFLKNHPRDAPFTLPETIAFDPITPIELWALTGRRPFDLGVALCSAALAHNTDNLCLRAQQLVSPERFHVTGFKSWQSELSARLQTALAS